MENEDKKLKSIFFVLSGPSGVGKTTATKSLVKLGFSMPPKITNRALKPSDNPDELISVERDSFETVVAQDESALQFSRHGNKYALLNINHEKFTGGKLCVQAIPPHYVSELREKYPSEFIFVSVRLTADQQVILARLEDRNDIVSENEKLSRLQTLNFGGTPDIDYYLNADRTPEEVVTSIVQLSRRYERGIAFDFIGKREKEILLEIQKLASALNTPIALFGGVSSYIYGADRVPTDIDIIVSTDTLQPFINLLEKFQPEEATKEKIIVGKLDLRLSPVRIGNKELGEVWHYDELAQKRSRPLPLGDLLLDFVSPEDMLVMKAALQRGKDRGKFDVEDARDILRSNSLVLDMSYIELRATMCNVDKKVLSFLGVTSNINRLASGSISPP